ncbi:hypothetical protein BDV95DRAFT_372161 [Massariosphaeria phaeospora]|uniref:DUF6590 domain-containing protein n=1 Tax=Massariosphaeria phaeospora TaxID=100035 RepID=A0A7C8I875_9PLEO|nr:hypothetical protein BDV95DRAFT_372161 [Massariosphaeria phaeospora]
MEVIDPASAHTWTISSATSASRRALERCLDVKDLMQDEWAENRLMDFNLWASGVGASAKPLASLDQRLESQPDVRAVVLGLLSTLVTFVDLCVDIGSAIHDDLIDDNEPNQLSEPVGVQASSTNESDPFLSWSDESSTSSADSSQLEPCLPPLQQAKNDVESILDQTIRLGMLIRSSGTASRLRKADAYFTYEDFRNLGNQTHKHSKKIPIEDLIELKAHLFAYLFLHSARHDSTVHQHNGFELDSEFQNLDPHQREVLEHLIFANLRRRNRFWYQRKHAGKLAVAQTVLFPEQANMMATEQNAVIKQQPLKEEPHPLVKPKFGGASTITGTAPSEGKIDLANFEKKQTHQQALSRASVSLQKSGWPHPPSMSDDRQTFRCPCCYFTLPSLQADRWHWRKHLSADLCPYTCLFPDCSMEDPLFVTRDAWKAHLQTEHKSLNYWECFACTNAGSAVVFFASADFMSHLRDLHKDAVSEDDASRLLTICVRSDPISFKTCPLCVLEPQPEDLEPEALLEHIADHVHDFSLHSLPWLDSRLERVSMPLSDDTLQKLSKWFEELESCDGPIEQDVPGYPSEAIVEDAIARLQVPQDEALILESLADARDNALLALDYFAESRGASSQAQADFDQDQPPILYASSESGASVSSYTMASPSLNPQYSGTWDPMGNGLGQAHSENESSNNPEERLARLREQIDNLDEDIVIVQKALTLEKNPGSTDHALMYDSLGASLKERFELTGSMISLQEAIMAVEHAIALTVDPNHRMESRLLDLAALMLRRYDHTGDISDVVQAKTKIEESLRYQSSSNSRIDSQLRLRDLQHRILTASPIAMSQQAHVEDYNDDHYDEEFHYHQPLAAARDAHYRRDRKFRVEIPPEPLLDKTPTHSSPTPSRRASFTQTPSVSPGIMDYRGQDIRGVLPMGWHKRLRGEEFEELEEMDKQRDTSRGRSPYPSRRATLSPNPSVGPGIQTARSRDISWSSTNPSIIDDAKLVDDRASPEKGYGSGDREHVLKPHLPRYQTHEIVTMIIRKDGMYPTKESLTVSRARLDSSETSWQYQLRNGHGELFQNGEWILETELRKVRGGTGRRSSRSPRTVVPHFRRHTISEDDAEEERPYSRRRSISRRGHHRRRLVSKDDAEEQRPYSRQRSISQRGEEDAEEQRPHSRRRSVSQASAAEQRRHLLETDQQIDVERREHAQLEKERQKVQESAFRSPSHFPKSSYVEEVDEDELSGEDVARGGINQYPIIEEINQPYAGSDDEERRFVLVSDPSAEDGSEPASTDPWKRDSGLSDPGERGRQAFSRRPSEASKPLRRRRDHAHSPYREPQKSFNSEIDHNPGLDTKDTPNAVELPHARESSSRDVTPSTHSSVDGDNWPSSDAMPPATALSSNPQFPAQHAIPPASKFPRPNLTAHTFGLLKDFKMNENPAPPPSDLRMSDRGRGKLEQQEPSAGALEYDEPHKDPNRKRNSSSLNRESTARGQQSTDASARVYPSQTEQFFVTGRVFQITVSSPAESSTAPTHPHIERYVVLKNCGKYSVCFLIRTLPKAIMDPSIMNHIYTGAEPPIRHSAGSEPLKVNPVNGAELPPQCFITYTVADIYYHDELRRLQLVEVGLVAKEHRRLLLYNYHEKGGDFNAL